VAADVRIRWHLELVGDVAGPLLRQDRQIRSSITQTERAQRQLATAAMSGSREQARGAQTATGAVQRQGRESQRTASDVQRLNRAQAEAVGAGSRLASSASRIAGAYRQQANAAREASGAERARAAAAKTASRGAGAAAGIGAGLGRAGQAAVGLAAGGGVLAKTVSIFAGFEQQMSRVAAVSGSTRGQMEAMTKQAEDLGAKTSFSAREAASGMYELSTAGFKADEVMRAIPGTLDLAAASGTDLASAAELQATALRGFGLNASQAGRVADALATTVNRSAVEMSDLQDSLKYIAPVARATGQSMESMLAAIGLMGNVGVKGSQAGTTLRTALVRLTAPTDKSRDALAKLHITAGELRGPKGLLPLPQILEKVVRGSQGVSKGTRNAALAAIFGREALSGMVAMVDKGPAALNRNIKALQNSEGTARKTAQTMRHNVAGAWDNFTGSVETAAITLTQRFSPAIQGALTGAAGGVNRGAKTISAAIGGLAAGAGGHDVHGQPARVTRGPGGRVEAVEAAKEPSRAAQIGQRIGSVARSIGKAAADAGGQLLAAFKPALPFFQNVLLPLLEGVGQGVLVSVVGAFKVLVPVIRVVSIALGAIGKVAAPLRPVFRGIGIVIGALAAGPILKFVSGIGKAGSIAAKFAETFPKIAGKMRAVTAIPRLLISAVSRGVSAIGDLGSAFLRLPGVVGRVAALAAGRLGALVGRVAGLGKSAVSAYLSFWRQLPGRIASLARTLGGAFLRLGKSVVSSVVEGIKSAPGAIIGALKGLVPGPLRDVAKHIPGNPLGFRRGGRVRRRYQDGGIVAAVSPGELVTYGEGAWTVPGPRSAADNVVTVLPVGAAVWTGDGQARLAAGEAPSSVLRTQAPHFRAGGVVQAGRYQSTAYGPPWGGIQGGGRTATGVDLHSSPHLYGVAVDPRRIPLGSSLYAWPNPFGYGGAFRAFDTGGAIKGNRLDFYDWRGRAAQNHWGRRNVQVSAHPLHGGGARTFEHGGAGAAPSVRILGRDRTRGGLIADAFTQGLQSGQEGATRGVLRAEGNPILAAIREQMASADRGGSNLSQRERGDSGGTIPDRMRSLAAGLRVPYRMGGGHGRFTRRPSALDCSGYVSNVLHYGGAHPELTAPAATGGLARYGAAGRGRRVTIHVRNGGPAGGHTMLTIDGKGYSSGNRATGRLSGRHDVGSAYLSTLPIKRHPRGLRRGGLVGIPRFQLGGVAGGGIALSRAASNAAGFAGHSLEGLDVVLGNVAETRILALRRALLTAVHRGGPQRVVQRLQAMLSEVDYELGRRVGRILDVVAQRTDRVTRAGGTQDRYLRRAGVDPASARGLMAQSFRAGAVDLPNLQANVRSLEGALGRARRAGNRAAVRDLTTQLNDAQDALDEAVTSQAERWRDFLKAQAQEGVDHAEHLLSLTQGTMTQQDTAQRLAGLASGSPLAGAIGGTLGFLGMRNAAATDTPEGMRQHASAIVTGLIPALQGQRGALTNQLTTARATGDVAGVRAAELALQSNANDLASAVGDAAQLLRDASVKASQDVVDQAAHGSTMASTGLQRLELEQRLAGTYDAGGAQRSGYITGTVVPALQSELDALKGQEETYRTQGMGAELRQTIEAEASKSNEILQAQLDAQEQIADNTDPKQFGGTLGFTFGGETLTDSLVTIGNGV
jgi:TP901 family phage tail tape measure protein